MKDKYDPNFKSSAKVEIKRITFIGLQSGGAADCLKAPDGWYGPAHSSTPLRC
jgi:hypothetical protein